MLVRVLVAGIVGAVVSFFGGYLIWGLALHSYFDSTMSQTAKTVMSAEPNFIPLVIAQIGYGVLYAVVLDWAGARSFSAGALTGGVLGFLMAFVFDLQMTAFMKDMHVGSPWMPLVVDIACATVLGTIVGAVVGFVHGKMNKGDATP